MTTAIATVSTENAQRYMTQLCKHWSHRFTADFDATNGSIDFGDDTTLKMIAHEHNLSMTLNVAHDTDITRMQQVVTDHLTRFAFREELHIDWQAA